MKRAIMLGLLFSAIAAGSFASEGDGIFRYKVGQLEVYMLVERQTQGNPAILLNADKAILDRYIPASGFFHSTNTYLIKAPGRNILIDTGFGETIFDKMKTLGVTPEQVDTVLLTHLHGDHIGGLLKDGKVVFTKAKIYVDAKDKEFFTATRVNQGVVAVMTAYGSNVITFNSTALGSTLRELIPGISPIANYGHTPGHTVYLIENGGAKLIIAGDFLHLALVQFPNPDLSATFDVDPVAAAASRRQILDYAARNRIPIGGMHIVYPAVGNVEASGSGFRFLPLAD